MTGGMSRAVQAIVAAAQAGELDVPPVARVSPQSAVLETIAAELRRLNEREEAKLQRLDQPISIEAQRTPTGGWTMTVRRSSVPVFPPVGGIPR